jgi:hypothetical protein
LDGIFVDDNGIQHPGKLLRNDDFREEHGIIEIPDPIRGDDETQYTQEIDVEPWVLITDKSPEHIEQLLINKLTNGVQAHLDSEAQTKGYDNILSASSYAGFNNAFQAEAISFLEWRSLVWTYAYQVLDDVKADLRPAPSIEELIAELPIRIEP